MNMDIVLVQLLMTRFVTDYTPNFLSFSYFFSTWIHSLQY